MADTSNLRPATADDRYTIAKLTRAAYEPYVKRLGYKPKPMAADHALWIEDGSVWVLEQSDEIVAAIVLLHGPDGLLVYNIAVAPPAQRKGLGSRLMAFAEQEAKAAGHEQIILYTDEKMTENMTFYEKLGYTRYNRLPHPSRETAWLIYLSKGV